MKGKFLKGFLVLFAACFLFLGAGVAEATSVEPVDPFIQEFKDPEQINFLIIDGGTVGFNFQNKNLAGGVVQYSKSGIKASDDWTTLEKKATILLSEGLLQEIIYLRLYIGEEADYDGVIEFSNSTEEIGVNGYSMLTIYWDIDNKENVENSSQFSMEIAKAPDAFAPAPVPLPATVWLLGAGLFAIVGIRRKGAE